MPSHAVRLTVFASLAVACGHATPPAATPPAPPPAPVVSAPAAPVAAPSAATATPAPAPALAFIDDDVARASAQAKADHKLLFVDAWAQWCHTCLSMRSYVLGDPALRPFAERVVFAAVDTDRPENAAFVERYAIDAWPTFFAIDPDSGKILGYWPGSASVQEMTRFLTESLDARDALAADKLPADSPLARLLAAKAAQAAHDYKAAADHYAAAIEVAPADWPRRSEALRGWVQSLSHAHRFSQCATVGTQHMNEVRGASMPADFLYYAFACTRALRPPERAAIRDKLVARMRQVAADTAADRSADDRADAYGILADALVELGDKQGALAANSARLAILEQAAASAPSPEAAATFDYGRALAYVALGRADDAVKLLEKRETELPDSFEPPARLADVLVALKRWKEALVAIDRALPKAYGPRKLRYLGTKAKIQQQLGDASGRVATLEALVAAYREAAHGGAAPPGLSDAEQQLDAARRSAKIPAPPTGPRGKSPTRGAPH